MNHGSEHISLPAQPSRPSRSIKQDTRADKEKGLSSMSPTLWFNDVSHHFLFKHVTSIKLHISVNVAIMYSLIIVVVTPAAIDSTTVLGIGRIARAWILPVGDGEFSS